MARGLERLASSRIGSKVILDPVLSWGWRRYLAAGSTPPLAYRAMRTSFFGGGTSFQRLEHLAAHEQPAVAFSAEPQGLLAGRQDDTLASLVRDGFVVLPNLLPAPACDEIEATARSSICRLVGQVVGAPEHARFDPDDPRAIRYDVPEEELIACAAVQDILADESLLSLAQDYLGAAPVQDLVAAWWSAPGPGSASAAAQLFHFDLDRPRFLKIFVYLSDVETDTGPHAYVRGTHRNLPPEFRADRRYSDAEVERRFPNDIVRIPGPRGTVFLADTRGLHKGEPVRSGYRLVFQLELASTLFGQTYTRPLLVGPVPSFSDAARRFPHVYRRFTINVA